MTEFFDIDTQDGVAYLQLSRPEKANAMNHEFWRELPLIINRLSASGKVRVCVVSARGSNFSSGMDLDFFAQPGFTNLEAARRREIVGDVVNRLQAAFDAIENARFPVIAAVQGACFGGALDMISACDFRFATEDARFSIEEINVGMMADLGSLQRLPYLMPEGIVRELAYTGERFSAQKALSYGLINRIYGSREEMLTEVKQIALKIAAKSPLAVSASKKSFNYSRNHGLCDALSFAQILQAGALEPGDVARAIRTTITGEPAAFDDLLAQIEPGSAPKPAATNHNKEADNG